MRKSKELKMTPLDWEIYNLIKARSIEGKTISSEELCDELEIETDYDAIKRKIARKSIFLYKRIEFINACPNIEKPIIWDKKSNYRIARDLEDVKEFVNRIYGEIAIRKLAKMSNLMKKAKADGTGKLLSENLKPIDDTSKAREYVEAFINYESL